MSSEVAVPLKPAGRPAGTFSRDYRLTRPADFDQLFKGGQRSADRCFTILYRPNGLDHPRLGFALAKRRIRRAVDRNRLRRRVRENFRLAAAELPAVDMVVMAKPGAESCRGVDLADSLKRHWNRIASATKARDRSDVHDG
jgi:ribonuclease P protein component